ncbi:fatty acid desaturase family protein [Niastella populi]|uniref:Fatty acid desaturase n=1 Tax=Niastella populi TaxID=550983 RepID=A0A1V9FPR9_9BACT|nr:acyl-CoA desaturase [Niastella populi]OQP60320.1 fatty acid desaturase [Niastella populi]
MPKVTFNNKDKSFFNTLKASVDQYFAEQKIKKTGNWRLYSKTIVLAPAAILLYSLLLFSSMPAVVAILLCCVLGFVIASIGFNVMHDACHGSYSSKSWVNETMALSSNLMGGNTYIWKFKHNIVHHTYTNIDGVDDDIALSPLMRQCSTQKWFPPHRYQHIYGFILYAFTSLAWFFVMDFTKYFNQKVHTTPMTKMTTRDHIIFWISKLLYVFLFVALPIKVVGLLPWVIGFIALNLTLGITLAVVFQLAHVVEHTEFVHFDQQDHMKIENEFAIHQIKTTANFAPRNKFISWYVGGLNYQVEHHLFPRISHVHYPEINKIVKQTCQQFGIKYNEFPTMQQAIASHYRMIRELGKKPVETVAA